MAGKVFFSVAMSLDGYIAPVDGGAFAALKEGRGDDPGLKRWMSQWGELQGWALRQRFMRENLKIGEGGETGPDDDFLRRTFERTGSTVLGKRMFEGGELGWAEDAPFHTPVFVLTHEVREPWKRLGGTVFHFVNDGIESALAQARDAAGDRDVRIGGGAETILQYLNAGLVDEFTISLRPVLFGAGVSLFDGVDPARVALDLTGTEASPSVTHLSYAVRRLSADRG
ncbi:dihydrofolate reductase family protein [Glycomyces albidus]|uniref:Dihydrofolate reductase n=1 Tax=Glycomyces albidus TaxID=2656774 RepID=A0A6L5GCP3_9ACTN|nr:dihydrofolate reductase family protein [Glycomyces albidus]MQM27467.1 dihydrofolate reductase [Glycomyces albidus]